jgi:hypothetical protein
MPNAVANELATHPDPVARDAIQNAIREGWLRIETAQDSPLLRILLLQLHSGEAEALEPHPVILLAAGDRCSRRTE